MPMTIEVWGALAIGAIVGVLLALGFLRRRGAADRERAEQLSRELEEVREELETQREDVAKHFAQTSDLFRDLTEQYTRLYAHLATGARDFCADAAPALAEGLDAPLLGDEFDEAPSEPDPAAGEAAPER